MNCDDLYLFLKPVISNLTTFKSTMQKIAKLFCRLHMKIKVSSKPARAPTSSHLS